MGNITPETVRAAIVEGDPMIQALSFILKQVSVETIRGLAELLSSLGVDAPSMPGEYLLQAMLVESDRVFRPISREDWLRIYDAYQEIKAIVDADPELKAMVTAQNAAAHPQAMPQAVPQAVSPAAPAVISDPLLDGNF